MPQMNNDDYCVYIQAEFHSSKTTLIYLLLAPRPDFSYGYVWYLKCRYLNGYIKFLIEMDNLEEYLEILKNHQRMGVEEPGSKNIDPILLEEAK